MLDPRVPGIAPLLLVDLAAVFQQLVGPVHNIYKLVCGQIGVMC